MSFKKPTAYLVFAANLLVILLFWWHGSGSLMMSRNLASVLIALGRITGLLAAYFILIQFILMGRVIWVEQVFGMDKLSHLHRWNGFAILYFLIGHVGFLSYGYAKLDNTSPTAQFLDFVNHFPNVSNALFGLIIIFLVGILSLAIIRFRLKYETWHFTHLLVVIGVIAAIGHQTSVGGDFMNNMPFFIYWGLLYLFVLLNFVLFRILRPVYYFYKHRFVVDYIKKETDDTISILIGGQNLREFPIKSGQFMILRFFAKGFWWQAHPFSVSAKPDGKYLRVTIKNKGDFTGDIQTKLKVGTFVLVDGPNGVFTAKAVKSDKVLLIAGGVGITPIRAIIDDLGERDKDIILLYGSRNSGDIIFKDELDMLSSKYNLKVRYILSNDPNWSGEKGRIDYEKIKRLVPDIREREVFLCGPSRMMDDAEKNLKQFNLKFSVHSESFAF